MDKLPAVRPACSVEGHGTMEYRSGSTPEQVWCGTWYRCQAPRCFNSTLYPSTALTAHLAGLAAEHLAGRR